MGWWGGRRAVSRYATDDRRRVVVEKIESRAMGTTISPK